MAQATAAIRGHMRELHRGAERLYILAADVRDTASEIDRAEQALQEKTEQIQALARDIGGLRGQLVGIHRLLHTEDAQQVFARVGEIPRAAGADGGRARRAAPAVGGRDRRDPAPGARASGVGSPLEGDGRTGGGGAACAGGGARCVPHAQCSVSLRRRRPWTPPRRRRACCCASATTPIWWGTSRALPHRLGGTRPDLLRATAGPGIDLPRGVPAVGRRPDGACVVDGNALAPCALLAHLERQREDLSRVLE